MGDYEVELYKHVFGDAGGDFAVTLTKTIRMPFPPTTDMSLGLYRDSEFSTNEDKVERVMWHVVRSVFLVELEEVRWQSPKPMVQHLLNEGWRLHVCVTFDSEKAAGYDEDRHIVQVGESAFYSLSDDELWTLREQRTPHTVLRVREE